MRIVPLLLAIIGFALAQEAPFPRDRVIDAAFRYEGKLFLISGEEYMAVGPDNFEAYIRERTGSTEVPVGLHVQAAVAWPKRPRVYFYGPNSSYRVDLPINHANVAKYSKYREFLQDGGPDAVSFMGGTFYLFKGCEYVSQSKTLYRLGQVGNSTDLGLPCDPDAAWTSGDYKTMTVLKGDQIWTLNGEDELAVGPTNFEDTYHIWSWQLAPTPDNRFPL